MSIAIAVTVYEMEDEAAAPRIPRTGMSSRLAAMFTARPPTMTSVAVPGWPRPTTYRDRTATTL